MNKKYSELAELFRSEKTDEEILDFLLNYHKKDIADTLRNPVSISGNCLWRVLRE